MKENLKNQLLILLLLLTMVVSIFLCVLIVVVDIFWLIKICVVLATISFTIYIFMLIKKVNKRLVYIPKDEEKNIEEKVENESIKKRILCPKCYHPYDGEICFVCGYKKNN